MNIDLIEKIFECADIDTKIALSRAYHQHTFRVGKITIDRMVNVEPWKTFKTDNKCEYSIEKWTHEIMNPVDVYIAYWGRTDV